MILTFFFSTRTRNTRVLVKKKKEKITINRRFRKVTNPAVVVTAMFYNDRNVIKLLLFVENVRLVEIFNKIRTHVVFARRLFESCTNSY